MLLIPDGRARAYVNFGRWIADCPADCKSAAELEPHQATYHCTECKTISAVEWPDQADEIMDALERRPAPRNRNWFPSGHTLAERAGVPTGQSVEELVEETFDNLGRV